MMRYAWLVIPGIAIIAVAALLPLRIVIDRMGQGGLGAESIDGTIWRGRIAGANYHGVALGDLATRVRPWPPGMSFTGPTLAGTLTPGGVEGLTGSIDSIGQLPFARVRFDGVAVATGAAGCTAATGQIAVVPAIWPAIGALEGPLTCDNGMLRAALAPPRGDARVDFALAPDRRFTLALRLGNVPALARLALLGAGFQDTPGGLMLTSQGRL